MAENPTEASIHNSYWLRQAKLRQQFSALVDEYHTEIVVVGAGITGLSIALDLLDRGHDVTVCEANTVASGTTGGSSGHLDAHPEIGPAELIEQCGLENAQLYTQLRLKAIDLIRERASEACRFASCSGYHYTEQATSINRLRKQCDAAKKIGLVASWVDDVPINRAVGGYRIDGLARIDPLAYVRHLADQVIDKGGKIFEHTLLPGSSDKHPKSLSSARGQIHFQQIVYAVHCNFTGSQRLYLQTPPYQSYLLVARINYPLPDGLFWDDSQPYYYVRRVTDEGRTILVGGCDHRTGNGDEKQALAKLEEWTRSRFQVVDITSRWSSELFETTDGLPFIGRVANTENVWIATGFSGIGLTLGTVAGGILGDLIDGRHHGLEELLSPDRHRLSSVLNVATEQAPVVGNYAERILPATSIDEASIKPGEGKVGKIDGRFVAVCRSLDGCVHEHNPICPHMGGVLHWNSVEQTWDCPVHGGRFDCAGTRLYGPPESNLPKPD